MARDANSVQMKRFRKVVTELEALDQELRQHGDHDAADAIKRARRELEVVVRQGLFAARGVNV